MADVFELVIVGAGPGGLSAALNAHKNNLEYLVLEKTDHLADTVYCYQKKKPVMAEPTPIPLQGDFWMEPALREEVLDHWERIVRENELNVRFNSAVTGISESDGLFEVKTADATMTARNVLLGIGTQGVPRKLGTPGEDMPHVLPRLTDPDLYVSRDVVVVGGGDAGVEVALALSEQNRVTLSVRSPEFVRVKTSLERQALEKQQKGELSIQFSSSVESVDAKCVKMKVPSGTAEIPAKVVIVRIGAELPRKFLESCGITFPLTLTAHYETNVPGLYLVGAANGRGDLIKYAVNQGYEAVEHILGREVEPADEELLKAKLHDFPTGTVSARINQIQPRVHLLAGAGEESIREMLLSSEFRRFKAGDVIFSQNDYSESLCMILEGTLELEMALQDGSTKSLGTAGPGECLGEMSMISGRRRTATVKGQTAGLIWEVGRKAMLKFIRTTPAASAFIDKTFVAHALRDLFPSLDLETRSALAEKTTVVPYEKDRVIFKEGEDADALYFLRSGKVKVSRLRDGREAVLAYLSAGQYFGERGLLQDEPRMATLTAIDRVEVIRVAKDDFLALLREHPDLQADIEREVRRRDLKNVEVAMRPELGELARFIVDEELAVSEDVLLIDENRCIQCDNCVSACKGVHEDNQTRIKRTGMKIANILVANSCRHCENPLCMTDCPPGDAIARDPRGEVYIRDNCIACGHCADNCPYDNIFMEYVEESTSPFDWLRRETPRKTQKVPVKCDLCRGLGSGPACVNSCPTGALLRLSPGEYNETMERLVLQRKGV